MDEKNKKETKRSISTMKKKIKSLIKSVLKETHYNKLKRKIKRLINRGLIIKKYIKKIFIKNQVNQSNTKENLKICFLVTEDNLSTVAGDFFSAYGLGEELIKQFRYEVIYLPKKPNNKWKYIPQDVDVIISMLEDLDIRTLSIPRDATVIAWVRGHIEEWCDNRSMKVFDGIITTSQVALNQLSINFKDKIWGLVPLAIPQGVRQQENKRDIEVSFIGNIYHVVRPIVKNLDLSQGFEFIFFGELEDKETHPWKSYHQGKLENKKIKEIYSRSKIVIEDIAPFNKGTVNLRVFEAAACGALVIANEDEALKELFGEAIIMYKDKQDLTQKIKFYLNNEEARIVQAYKLQQIILKKHTFEQRALAFQQILEQHIGVNLHYE